MQSYGIVADRLLTGSLCPKGPAMTALDRALATLISCQ